MYTVRCIPYIKVNVKKDKHYINISIIKIAYSKCEIHYACTCRRYVFSNTAAENISEIALNQWNSSLKREDICLKEIEKVISTTIINKKESK